MVICFGVCATEVSSCTLICGICPSNFNPAIILSNSIFCNSTISARIAISICFNCGSAACGSSQHELRQDPRPQLPTAVSSFALSTAIVVFLQEFPICISMRETIRWEKNQNKGLILYHGRNFWNLSHACRSLRSALAGFCAALRSMPIV